MPIKIAFPKKEYYKVLIENFQEIEKKFDLEMIFCNDKEAADLLKTGGADLALLNPLTYGLILQSDEYKLLPSTCISAINFTNLEKVYFAENLKFISTVAMESDDLFIALITKLILLEKYNFETKTSVFNGKVKDALKQYEAYVTTKTCDKTHSPLDLSEEWFDTLEYELPLGFWVIKNDSDSDSDLMMNITKELSKEELPYSIKVNEHILENETDYQREGEIKYQFDSQTETAIDNIMELLYQLGYLDDIADSKIVQTLN